MRYRDVHQGRPWIICAPFATCLMILVVATNIDSSYQQRDSTTLLKTESFYIELDHKLGSEANFKPRGSILVRPKTEHRPSQASFVKQHELTKADLKLLADSSDKEDLYYLRSTYLDRKANKNGAPSKTTQTIVKACSLRAANLEDYISINLNPVNEFLTINLYTSNQDCMGHAGESLPSKFNTTLIVTSTSLGPQPDTVTYIKRLEEERQSKLKEGKEDNRSFLAKYWIYIVPGVIILMMLGGPEQGAR